MLEEMTDDELRAEHKRAIQLAAVCVDRGFVQAATVWTHTAQALLAALQLRLSMTN